MRSLLILLLTGLLGECYSRQYLVETTHVRKARPNVGRADVAVAPPAADAAAPAAPPAAEAVAPAAPAAESAAPEAPVAEAPAAEEPSVLAPAPVPSNSARAAGNKSWNQLFAKYKTFLNTLKGLLDKGESIPDTEFVAFGKLVEAAVKENPGEFKLADEIPISGPESEAPDAPDAALAPVAIPPEPETGGAPEATTAPAAPVASRRRRRRRRH